MGMFWEKSRSLKWRARGSEDDQAKKMWKAQVEKESKSVGLEKEDAMNQARWRVGVGEIAVRMG